MMQTVKTREGGGRWLSSLLLIEVFVRGQAQLSSNFDASGSAQAKGESDERYVRRLAQLIDPDGFPAITEAMGAAGGKHASFTGH